MLESLRRMGRTWFGKVVGAFLIVGLAGFGISNVLLDFGANNVAAIGDDEISVRAFQRAYNSDLNRFGQQIGRVPTGPEALQLGIPSNTLNRLASEAVLNRLGLNMGLGVSEERLSRMLRQDPTFAGTLGTFQPENFVRILQQLGFTEAEYFDLQRQASRRQQIVAAMFADAPAPAAAQELLTRFTGDTRTIDYFVLNAQAIEPVAEPTDAEIADYLAENQEQFQTAEERRADILVLTLETLAATEQIDESEIAAEYERTQDSRAVPERRSIVQAPLTAEQQAAFEAGQAADRPFPDIAEEAGIEIVSLGTLTRDQVTDTSLATAAFGLAEVGDFAIIPGIGGQRVVSVTAIEEGGTSALDEVRDEIERSLQMAAARDAYNDVLDQVEELRAAFQPLSDIAERFGLPLHEVTITASGAELADIASIPADVRGRVASTIFNAELDTLTPSITLSANSHIFADLKNIEPVRDLTLDEVRDEITAAIVTERTREALAAQVEEIVTRLEAGESFADVALSLNQFPSLSPPLTRGGSSSPVIDQNVATAAFSGGPGHVGSAVNGDGDHVIFEVVDIVAAEEADPALAAYVADTTQRSLLGEFINGLRSQAPLRVNQQTLNQLLALDETGL